MYRYTILLASTSYQYDRNWCLRTRLPRVHTLFQCFFEREKTCVGPYVAYAESNKYTIVIINLRIFGNSSIFELGGSFAPRAICPHSQYDARVVTRFDFKRRIASKGRAAHDRRHAAQEEEDPGSGQGKGVSGCGIVVGFREKEEKIPNRCKNRFNFHDFST